MATKKLATDEARLLIGTEDIGIVGVKYLIAVLGVEPGENLKHLNLLPHCQYLIRFEHCRVSTLARLAACVDW